MCMIDDCDPCDVYSAKVVKARKPHKCSECGRQISPGESYHYAFMVQEGHGDSFHTCQHCFVGAQWLITNCGGFVHYSVLEEIREHASEYPYLSDGLAALADGMTSQWKNMPVPAMPAPITVAEQSP